MEKALIQRHEQGSLDDGDPIDASAAASRVLAGDLKKDEFVCRGKHCGVEVHLCSFRAHNLKEPYFAANTGDGHKPRCSVVSGSQGSGGLVDDADISVFIDEDPEDAVREGSGQGRLPFAGRSTSQLVRLVRAYAAQPDKSDRPLRIPEVHGRTYWKCFFPLDGAATVQHGDRRVYYGTVRFKARSTETEDGIILRMRRPERKDEPRHVIIDSRAWTPEQRNTLNERLLYLLRETRNAWAANNSSPRAIFLFVLAAPMAGNRFRIDSPRHYCVGDSNDMPGLLQLPNRPWLAPPRRQRRKVSTLAVPATAQTPAPLVPQPKVPVPDEKLVQSPVQEVREGVQDAGPEQPVFRTLVAPIARIIRWLRELVRSEH